MKKYFKPLLVILVLLFLVSIVGCKKKEEKPVIKETKKPYTLYMEWNSKIFEPYGFSNLVAPAGVYHEYCEEGETYAYGEFYTDDFSKYKYFVERVYNTVWGEVRDVEKILKENNGVYSFENKCLIPVPRDKVTEFDGNIEYTDKHMTVLIEYDKNENKVTIRCQMAEEENKDTSKKKKSK